jgi:HlyD family secretion protein
MDRQLPKEVITKRRRKRLIAGISVLASIMIIVWVIGKIGSRAIEWSRIKYSVAEYGSVEATLNASGTIVPETEQAITAPVASILRRSLLYPGDYVKKGQAILELDKEDLQTEREKTQKELELLEHRKSQTSLDLEQKQAELKASEEVKQLQAGFADDQYNRIKRLNEIGATSGEDLQRAFIAAEIARRELTVLNLQIVNHRAAAEVELQSLDLQIHIQKEKLADINHRLVLSDAPAPLDGIITWVNDSIGFPVREGDVVARVADLSRYRLQGDISSINANQLSVGQTVIIRIGEKIVRGKISSVSPTMLRLQSENEPG